MKIRFEILSVKEVRSMNIDFAAFNPWVSIIFGVLILVFPRFLNYFVAAYLILTGLLGLGILR